MQKSMEVSTHSHHCHSHFDVTSHDRNSALRITVSGARGPVVSWEQEGSLGEVLVSEEPGDCLVRTKGWGQDVSGP